MNENLDVSSPIVKEIIGHFQLSTTFIYTNANKKKKSN